MITIGTFIYGFGVAVGFENNIALVPVATLISSAIGCSALVGTTMALAGSVLVLRSRRSILTPLASPKTSLNCPHFQAQG